MSLLCLIHGFTGRPASWAGVVAELPPGSEVARERVLGHDPALLADSSWDAEIDRLAAAVRARGATPAHLVGYSLGARLGLGLLARHPGLFARATLVGGRLPPVQRAERAAADEAWARLLDERGIAAFVSAWEAQAWFASQQRLRPEVRAREHAARLAHSAAGLAVALRRLGLAHMPDYRAALARVRVPVALVHGAEDVAFAAAARDLAATIPGARIRVVERAGHNVPIEQPAALAGILSEEP